MKKQISLLLFLLLTIAYQLSAFTVIITGGTRNNKYHYVRLNNTVLICKGRGPNLCPPFTTGGNESSVWHSSDNIEDYVLSQVSNGKTEGSVIFENDLPIRWKTVEDGCIQIDIDDTGVKGLENYENPE